jgi:hypothetical protein
MRLPSKKEVENDPSILGDECPETPANHTFQDPVFIGKGMFKHDQVHLTG